MEENTKHSLFLLDCKNLLGSVRNLYGSEARLDFKKLKDIAIRGSEEKTDSLSLAFLDLDNPWISTLSSVLSTVGYRLITYGPHIAEEKLSTSYMIVQGVSLYEDYKRIVIASGCGDLVPLYEFLQNKSRSVEVMAFPEDLSSKVAKYVDTLIELTDSILMDGSK